MGELLRISFESLDANRAAVMILQNQHQYLRGRTRFAYLRPLQQDIDTVWRDALEMGIRGREFRADLDVSTVYQFIRDVIFAAARWYRSGANDCGQDAGARADAYRQVILHGLLR